MFAKIIQWIREFLGKMINTSSVKDALKVDVAISPLMVAALTKWTEMYTNQSPWLSDDIKSLNLAAAISSEIARAVTIEMDVEISGSLRADYLSDQLDPVLGQLSEKQSWLVQKVG